jgi:hypothetical protein
LRRLDDLTRTLGLGRYRWLPVELWLAFAAEALGGSVEITVPDTLLSYYFFSVMESPAKLRVS